ncbi:MAG TPA: serine protease [Gemmatimonadales bacterium]
MSRSVVKIQVDLLDGSASGSGVIIDPSGVIATAAHVIAGSRGAQVRLSTGETMKVEGVIEVDTDHDIALIRVAGFELPTAKLGNADSIQVGQRLFAIGAPIGLETTVTDGLLSAIRMEGGRKLLQISIPVSHGSSGGPVFTEDGKVVGLVVSGFRADVAENVNFAVPINYVRGKLALAAQKTPIPLAQAAVVMPTGNGVRAPGAAAGQNEPEVVNAQLALDWKVLKGAQVYQEIEGERGLRQTALAQYDLTTDPAGVPLLVRHLNLRTRVRYKVAPLRSTTTDVADDVINTELTLAPSPRLHERVQHTSYVAANPSGITDLLIDGRQFSWTGLGGENKDGVIPQGTLTPQLLGGAIAAMPDSLPAVFFVYVFDGTTGRSEPTRVEVGQRKRLSIPVSRLGDPCGPDTETRDTTVDVVQITTASGANRLQYPVLASRPHLSVNPDNLKCIRLPGSGTQSH